jgi:hypothetical protein
MPFLRSSIELLCAFVDLHGDGFKAMRRLRASRPHLQNSQAFLACAFTILSIFCLILLRILCTLGLLRSTFVRLEAPIDRNETAGRTG